MKNVYLTLIVFTFYCCTFAMEDPNNNSDPDDTSSYITTSLNKKKKKKSAKNKQLLQLQNNDLETYYSSEDESQSATRRRRKIYTIDGSVMLNLQGLKEEIECSLESRKYKKKYFSKKKHAGIPIEFVQIPTSKKNKATQSIEIITLSTLSKNKENDDFYIFEPYKNLKTNNTHLEIRTTKKIQKLMLTLSKCINLNLISSGCIDFYSDNANVSAHGGWIAKHDEHHELYGSYLNKITNYQLGENVKKNNDPPIVHIKTVSRKLINLYPLPKQENES